MLLRARSLAGLPIAVAALAVACRSGEPVAPSGEHAPLGRAYPPPAEHAVDAGAARHASAAGSATPQFIVPAREPLPIAAMVLKAAEPLKTRPLPPGKRLGHGGVVTPGIPSPDRVAIVTTGGKGALVDARSGRIIVALPHEPRHVAPRAGVIVLESKTPSLVRLRDNTLVALSIDAGGRSLSATWVAATDAHPHAIVIAETGTGEKLAGLASDDLTTVKLSPTPIDPASIRFAATLNTLDWQVSASFPAGLMGGHGTPFSFPHEPGCVRAKVADDGTSSCLEHLPYAGMIGVAWTADGWFIGEDFASHVSFGAKTIPFDDARNPAMCITRAHRATPPRGVVTCHARSDALVWAPGKLFTWKGPADPNDVGGLLGAEAGPVLPIVDVKASPSADRSASSSTRWLDLVGLRILTSPPMRPLAIAAFAGLDSLALAEERAERSSSADVYAVDFDKGTRELVAKISDCPGQLGELREEGARGRSRWLVLACLTPPPKDGVARSLIWSEIVDLERRVRWRTPLLPELFLPDGVVVLSTRRALSAESKIAPGDLFSVDLASPGP